MSIPLPNTPAPQPIFPDISELDRAGGRVRLSKFFASPPPDDDGTFVALFRTED